jgi:hypothetical protein
MDAQTQNAASACRFCSRTRALMKTRAGFVLIGLSAITAMLAASVLADWMEEAAFDGLFASLLTMIGI